MMMGLKFIKTLTIGELDRIISEHPDIPTRDYLEELRDRMSNEALPSAIAHRIADEWSGDSEETRDKMEEVLTEALALLPVSRLKELVGTEVIEDDWDEPIDEEVL